MKKQLDPKAADALLRVADAAVNWWVSKRPLAMSCDSHIKNPSLNCSGTAEEILGKSVAEWIKIMYPSTSGGRGMPPL